jgi:oxygen-independent coproporphyrinogen-3 oxidase
MPIGLYISVPFCRTKCTYCNFASGVFPRAVFERYLDRICWDIHTTPQLARQMGGRFDVEVDSVYLGGGTPTVLDCQQLERVFVTVRQSFCLVPKTEITVECAPGTLTPAVTETLLKCGVNRVSLGVQSFVEQEAAAVGRRHNRATVLDDVERLRRAGVANINLDLIAGLPHQTAASWTISVESAIALGVPHVSVYMLEIDEDSRLGRELIAGGTKYHAHFVPDEELTVDLYETACEQLNAAGVAQYEISNFAREGSRSQHNLKYWTRQPYLGFGVDAHSMLLTAHDHCQAVRFSTPDTLEHYLTAAPWSRTEISRQGALEETFFLGLRLVEGVNLNEVRAQFGAPAVTALTPRLAELADAGLIEQPGERIRLTGRGRLLSNEVFERFLDGAPTPARERVTSRKTGV